MALSLLSVQDKLKFLVLVPHFCGSWKTATDNLSFGKKSGLESL